MLSSLTVEEILNALTPHKGITVIVTVGNTMRSDDGVGPYIASKIKSTVNLKIINTAFNPENIIDEVCSLAPERVIFIDAADFRGKQGDARIVNSDNIPETSLSTHSIPLKVIAKLVESDTNADIAYIGIQPGNVEFGEELSGEVKKTADEIIQIIKKEFYHA